uniref:ATP synthase complex subunit 8 n=1 Tax=Curculionidae sp. BMNH 1274272 TaxID=1796500 RepID=A0A126TF48_9CUCU|nr:ATP synthase F0 subunit 8 [Curculionidae sp. BMNH 1274272]
MPQMAPLNWITLFIFFTILFLLMIILNFYLFLYPPKTFIKPFKTPTYSWKW